MARWYSGMGCWTLSGAFALALRGWGGLGPGGTLFPARRQWLAPQYPLVVLLYYFIVNWTPNQVHDMITAVAFFVAHVMMIDKWES